MRFVNVATAKGLKIGEPVFTLNKDGEYGAGKLIERKESEHGSELKFEVPQYFDQNKPVVMPKIVTNITHVCLQKNRKQDDIQE